MTFKRFEEIEAWQLARELCRVVRRLTLKPEFYNDWELRKQIRSSSGSAMDCIAEGHERGNNNEFKYFLGISQGSCGEVRSQGYRALDYGYINQAELDELCSIALRTAAAVQGLSRYLNNTTIKGRRYPVTRSSQKLNDPNFPSQEPPFL